MQPGGRPALISRRSAASAATSAQSTDPARAEYLNGLGGRRVAGGGVFAATRRRPRSASCQQPAAGELQIGQPSGATRAAKSPKAIANLSMARNITALQCCRATLSGTCCSGGGRAKRRKQPAGNSRRLFLTWRRSLESLLSLLSLSTLLVIDYGHLSGPIWLPYLARHLAKMIFHLDAASYMAGLFTAAGHKAACWPAKANWDTWPTSVPPTSPLMKARKRRLAATSQGPKWSAHCVSTRFAIYSANCCRRLDINLPNQTRYKVIQKVGSLCRRHRPRCAHIDAASLLAAGLAQSAPNDA